MKETGVTILVVAAHPHDFTHCAGTLGVHVSRGDKVTVVCMTPARTFPAGAVP